MPISTTCPHCHTAHRLADELLGKKIRCKSCRQVILVQDARPGAAGKLQPEPAAGTSEVDERIQPDSKRPKRASAELEEEPVRPRRRDRDEEDEDRPRSHDRYDDDDRPRGRRRERDDADLFPRPNRRRPAQKSLLIPLLACGGAVVLLGVGILVLILLTSGGKSGKPGEPDSVDLSGSWPEVPQPIGPTVVTLHIADLVDENTTHAVSDKIPLLADPGGGHFMSSVRMGSRMTVRLGPVSDPQRCAARIDFGTVHSVSGRTITVVARKVEGPAANADLVTKALYELKSPAAHRRTEAVRRLKDTLPDAARRAEVARALEPLLNDPDQFARATVIEALGIWGTKESVPLLIKAMSPKETRNDAMKALGRLKDERAIEPIAGRLEDPFDRGAAADALKAFGRAAEKAVLERLSHLDGGVRQEACRILEVIGTRESIPALKRVIEVGDAQAKGWAEQAIKAITARS
jgi:predicted Zn finger-like uncharacterized protein